MRPASLRVLLGGDGAPCHKRQAGGGGGGRLLSNDFRVMRAAQRQRGI